MPLTVAAAARDISELGADRVALLCLLGLIAGIGITSLGPGGVLVTIGLVTLSSLSPAAVAGTGIVTNIGTGLLGTREYARSGHLSQRETRDVALVLIAAALIGTPLGVLANRQVSGAAFGALLGVCVMAVGLLLCIRERREGGRPEAPDRLPPRNVVFVIGLGVGVLSGLFGLGGPLLTVPLLVVAGTSMLPALGAAQAQSIVIAAIGTLGYVIQGSVSWPIAVVIGVPELAGVLIGSKVARALPARRLRFALAGLLVVIGPYLILHNVHWPLG